MNGHKTQTRRAIKRQPPDDVPPITVSHYHPTTIDRRGDEEPGPEIFGAFSGDGEWECKSPFGEPGDQLRIRETHFIRIRPEDATDGRGRAWYHVDCPDAPVRWKPSVRMPRWASRITLEITGVRAEHLNDCSEDDARAEGSEAIGITFRRDADGKPRLVDSLGGPHRDGFRILWESINGAGAWNANPWVWVVEFRSVVRCDNRDRH